MVNNPTSSATLLERAARLIAVGNTASDCGCGTTAEVDAGQCPIPQPEFPRFFAGQLVGPDDLTGVEQRVFTHEQMRARHLFGWGISCGFRVALGGTTVQGNTNAGLAAYEPPSGIALAGSTLTVEHGYGLDRYGRDVYLAADRQFSLETLFAERQARITAAMSDPWCVIPNCQPTPPTHYCVAVRYRECPDKPVPSYAQQCGTPKTVCEYSRVREDVEIRLFGDNEFPAIPAGAAQNSWCGMPEADAELVRLFLSGITIPQGATDVASTTGVTSAYTNLAAGVSGAADERGGGDCEDLLHLPRGCDPCMDWPWIPLACFTLTGTTISGLDCRVRRTIYSLQELEALVIRMFCLLVHQR